MVSFALSLGPHSMQGKPQKASQCLQLVLETVLEFQPLPLVLVVFVLTIAQALHGAASFGIRREYMCSSGEP